MEFVMKRRSISASKKKKTHTKHICIKAFYIENGLAILLSSVLHPFTRAAGLIAIGGGNEQSPYMVPPKIHGNGQTHHWKYSIKDDEIYAYIWVAISNDICVQ